MASFCRNCGKQSKEGGAFCAACGMPLTTFSPAQAPPATSTPESTPPSETPPTEETPPETPPPETPPPDLPPNHISAQFFDLVQNGVAFYLDYIDVTPDSAKNDVANDQGDLWYHVNHPHDTPSDCPAG